MAHTVKIMGIPFSTWTLAETTDQLTSHVEKASRMLHLMTVNPEIAMRSQSDAHLQMILREADVITPDGVGIVMASKRSGTPVPERVTGYELLLELLAKGDEKRWGFYFLGTDEETNCLAVENIRQRFPQVIISGRHHGFFAEGDEAMILQDIQQTKPDVLIVAMGAPRSDKWMHQHKQALSGVKLGFGVGGSLDVLSGKVKPTPGFWKTLQLEWLHRLLTAKVAKGQPSRWRRQAILPKFVYHAILKKS
ncbi:WecB/TagA/CpsF family glycosyltransferase [Aureibacillus halotolerans]|uniref:N-acetylglucosaminyldiphosphoundecaprenol N-acetyl-beta-D-mannosaminyltransferase n=1 Tax=Aureibacillus halotolerans TaxID=1508390 RepID=A0A4R6U5Y9_9BACI|nr:WecB/TagA/CpsF family glycosyltransferase [Aureibacillus halotolerans]TDQ41176.1 N-acetylglucosaminyldiphosphoundecaprenol N-acetyl-beta-D-mannosaminyltransferase [Aureibacillus halotolerans]